MQELIFGLCFEYVKQGDPLLDLGIGTGLSSIPFVKAGMEIFGLDGSAAMLKECEKKRFAKELKEHDVENVPLPYSDEKFQIVICCGMLHSFGDFAPIAKDVQRILQPGGVFAFSIAVLDSDTEKKDSKNPANFSQSISAWNTPIFQHSDQYVSDLVKKTGFTIEKEQKILVETGEKDEEMLFGMIVLKK